MLGFDIVGKTVSCGRSTDGNTDLLDYGFIDINFCFSLYELQRYQCIHCLKQKANPLMLKMLNPRNSLLSVDNQQEKVEKSSPGNCLISTLGNILQKTRY